MFVLSVQKEMEPEGHLTFGHFQCWRAFLEEAGAGAGAFTKKI